MAGGPIRLPIVSKFDDKGVRDAERALTNFGKNAGIALGAATAAVTAFGAMSVKAFADFDAEMTKSLAIMGNVSDALRDDMAQAAREVAKETTFSANQAAESFFFLASAGLDATSSIQAMPQVARFAQAGMFDMALATDLLTDAQSALGLTVRDDAIKNLENMTRVSDVLVKANTLANASVEQFSKSLTTKAGAALKSVGKDIEEGVAVLAAFADQGVKAEEAGTQLSIIMRDLTTKAIDNKAEFRRLGIEVFDSSGELANLGSIIGGLEVALAGMSDETAKATLLQLGFSDRSLGSLLTLLGTSEAIKTYEAALRDAGGTTDEVANKQLETFNAQLELMKSRFQDVMISVGEGLTPAITQFAEDLGPILDQLGPALIQLFEELGPVIVELAEALPGFIEDLIPLIPVIGDLATLTLSLAQAIMPVLSSVIDAFGPVIEGFTGQLADNGEVFGALILAGALFISTLKILSTWLGITGGAGLTAAAGQKGFLGVVFSGLGVIAAAIAGAAGLAYYLFNVGQTTEELNPVFRGFLEGLAYLVAGTAQAIQSITISAIGQMNGLLNAATKGIEAAYNAVATALGKKTITLQAPVIPLPKLTTAEDLMKAMGLTKEPTAPRRPLANVGYGPNQFAPNFLQQRQAEFFRTPSLPAAFQAPDYLRGRTPLSPEFINAQRLQFERGISGFPGLGTGMPADQRRYEITVNAGLGTDPTQLGDEIYNILLQYDRYAAPVFQSARQ